MPCTLYEMTMTLPAYTKRRYDKAKDDVASLAYYLQRAREAAILNPADSTRFLVTVYRSKYRRAQARRRYWKARYQAVWSTRNERAA